MDQMRLAWPIEDPLVPLRALIDEAVADAPNVLARLGYQAAGLPHDWDIVDRGIPGLGRHQSAIVCDIDVIANHTEQKEAA